jgi:hypothetical protein
VGSSPRCSKLACAQRPARVCVWQGGRAAGYGLLCRVWFLHIIRCDCTAQHLQHQVHLQPSTAISTALAAPTPTPVQHCQGPPLPRPPPQKGPPASPWGTCLTRLTWKCSALPVFLRNRFSACRGQGTHRQGGGHMQLKLSVYCFSDLLKENHLPVEAAGSNWFCRGDIHQH